MLHDPSRKYRPFPPIDLPDRAWPSRIIDRAPIWLSTDLRDGNQALFEPMSVDTKLRFFDLLIRAGFKEIEIAFPSASDTDFELVGRLIRSDRIPNDVTIAVLTQARDHLIDRTFEALRGARRAIVHLYNATAPNFRRTVFGLDKAGIREIAVSAARRILQRASESPSTQWIFEYTPETFSGTELPFAKEICDAVIDVWNPSPDRKAIVNLPATVELATPNVYADQIEWMHRHLARRDSIILSVHPHNDRGTAVAAAELAVMAGAERVEGCLFGNGERTGNVDLITLALNLYTQGVSPGLDLSNINNVARVVEECNKLPIHPRHPYVGDLVFTAFSGSHQDAIKKGFHAQDPESIWEVPYLPIDPADIGRTYESIIRINSQSGKGGVAYLLETEHNLVLPRRMQIEFSQVVQIFADESGGEVTSANLWDLFTQEYLDRTLPLEYVDHHLMESEGRQAIAITVRQSGVETKLHGIGNGPIDALLAALNAPVTLQHFEERSLGCGADAKAVAIMEFAVSGLRGTVFGAGIHSNIVTASIAAVLSGLNRSYAMLDAVANPVCIGGQGE